MVPAWEFKTESIRKVSNFNFHWTKTLYQNNLNHTALFVLQFSSVIDVIIITSIAMMCNNTKENFLWEPEKINVKFHKNCKNR